MRILRQWPFLLYAGAVPWYHVTQLTNCECATGVSLERQPRSEPVQPEQWASVISDHLERPSIETSAPGTTVWTGTGKLRLTAHAPEILAKAVEIVRSSLTS